MVSYRLFCIFAFFTTPTRAYITTSSTRVSIAIPRAFLAPRATITYTTPFTQPKRSYFATPTTTLQMSSEGEGDSRYSLADQVARFARAKRENNQRYLDITTVYDPSYLKGKRVAITGCNRGLGLALAKEVTEAGAKLVAITRSSSEELQSLQPAELITGVDVTNDASTAKISEQIKGGPIDILINNAGYFKEQVEKIDCLDFQDELKTIDICAIGILRVTASLYNGGLLKEGSKVVAITSQGGSISWRPVQCPEGGDYGHHMSKAAANMAAMLLAMELRSKGIAVGIFHPGFNKTEMTSKYQEIWEVEGAVDPSIGAKRVMYETGRLSLETTGKFINCEDGLEIPF